MTVSLKHLVTATGTDAGNGQIGKAQWNDEHALTLASQKLLGRASAGTGSVEEIDLTAAGRALLDDPDATAQRATLGLGSVAVENVVPVFKGGTGAIDEASARVNLGLNTTVNQTFTAAGGVSRSVFSKLSDIVSVKDFGATGNGTTDDTAAIQAALNANAGAVYFPKGTYLIQPITVPAGTYIKTDGFDTVFQRNPASANTVRTIRVGGSNVEIESFSFIGDIATGTFEWNHCLFIYAEASTGAISNVTIHDIYGQNIRGDIIEMGGLPAYPLKNVRVGRISGNNILRNGVSVLGGENIEIQSINVTNVGLFAFDIEPDPYNQAATGVKVWHIAGKAVAVVPPSPVNFASGVEFGVLELEPTIYGTNSTPPYAPPGGEQTAGLTVRNVKDIRIGKLKAANYGSFAINTVFNGGELGCQDMQIGVLDVANCGATESTYNAYVWGGSAMQRLTINSLIADASATPSKAIIKDVIDVVLTNTSATLSNSTSLLRGCTRVVVDNAVVTGGALLIGVSGGAVRNVQLNGESLAGFCSPMTFENVTATASSFIFDSGNQNHIVHNSTLNSVYFAGGFYKQQHTTALRFGNNWLWVDATGKLRIRNGSAPSSDTGGSVVGPQPILNVADYGATGDGAANDAPAIQAAIDAAAAAGGGTVVVPEGTYLCNSQIVHKANVDVVGTGGSTIKKGFNGDLWSIAISGAELRDLYFDGSHGTYTGKGVVCSGGAACWRPFISNVVFDSFTGSHIEFTANSGESAIVDNCRFSPGTGQTDVRYIHFNGPDTGATFRTVTGCTCELGYVDVDGAQALTISNSVFKRVETDPACELVIIQGMRWANSGGSVTIYGATYVVNCAIGGDVILDSTFGGVFVGNQQTAGSFTNNALGSTVIARDGSGGKNYLLGRLAAFYLPSGTERIQTGRMANVASTDQTLTVGGSARTINVTGPLTGNVVYTLSGTDAINGDRFRIVRATSATGAFTIDVGGLKSLSVGQWCDIEYNGSTWYLTAFGSL